MKRFVSGLLVLFAFSQAPAWGEINNINSSFIKVSSCEGKGESVVKAMAKARQTVLDEAVKKHLLQTRDEWDAYLAVRSQFIEEIDRFVSDLQLKDKYRTDGMVIAVVDAQVDRKALQSKLQELKVSQNYDQRGPRVLVLPDLASEEQEVSTFAISRISSILGEHHLETLDLGAIASLKKEDSKVIGGDATTMGIRTEADVILTVKVLLKHTREFGALSFYQAEVTISAYAHGYDLPLDQQHYVSRELTFKTSEDRIKTQKAALEEAIGGAAEPLLQSVLRISKEAATLGKYFTFRCQGIAEPGDAGPLIKSLIQLNAQGVECKSSNISGEWLVRGRFKGDFEELIERLMAQPTLNKDWKVEAEGLQEITLRHK